MNTIPNDWIPFWLRLDRELASMPPSYDLLIHATLTPEPELPALDAALDDLAQQEGAR
jgi:hypothetical protein